MALRRGPRKTEKQKTPGPARKKGSTWGRVAFAVLVTLAVLALAFFLVIRDAQRTSVAENIVGSVFTPIQNAVSSATRYVRDLIDGAKDYFQMSEDLALARQEIAVLELQNAELEEYAHENERYRELLGAKETHDDMEPLFADVVGRGPGVWMDTFTINRGTKDGVAVNNPVMTADGLAGRVYEVGLNYAKVLSIIDPRSAIGCLVERTRDPGSMRGKITSASTTAECHMYYLPAVNDIVPGDVVLTSGTDNLLPKGLVVGTVASVSRQSDLADQYVVVLPAVDFVHIEEVLVLRVVVESEKSLAALPTPTPRPTPTPSPTPRPAEGQEEDETDETPYWSYPTPLPEFDLPAGEQEPEPAATSTPSPTPTYDPETMAPEDRWAQGG